MKVSTNLLMAFVIALILVGKGLEAGSVLEPTISDPRRPAVPGTISVQHAQHTSHNPMVHETKMLLPKLTNRLHHDADSATKRRQCPRHDDS